MVPEKIEILFVRDLQFLRRCSTNWFSKLHALLRVLSTLHVHELIIEASQVWAPTTLILPGHKERLSSSRESCKKHLIHSNVGTGSDSETAR